MSQEYAVYIGGMPKTCERNVIYRTLKKHVYITKMDMPKAHNQGRQKNKGHCYLHVRDQEEVDKLLKMGTIKIRNTDCKIVPYEKNEKRLQEERDGKAPVFDSARNTRRNSVCSYSTDVHENKPFEFEKFASQVKEKMNGNYDGRSTPNESMSGYASESNVDWCSVAEDDEEDYVCRQDTIKACEENTEDDSLLNLPKIQISSKSDNITVNEVGYSKAFIPIQVANLANQVVPVSYFTNYFGLDEISAGLVAAKANQMIQSGEITYDRFMDMYQTSLYNEYVKQIYSQMYGEQVSM